MASITTILGTDSLASSRIVLNDNFASINDEVGDITTLLDVNLQNLTLTGGVSASTLTLTGKLVVNSSDIIASLPLTVEDSLILTGGLQHSVAQAAVMPAANSYNKSTYLLDGATLTGVNVLTDGDNGQTVTFIAENGSITIDTSLGLVAGASTSSNIVIAQNGTLTLRFYAGLWYVVSYFNALVTV